MSCSSTAACGVFIFYIVCSGIQVDDRVDQCEDLSLTAKFLVSSYFLFLFCI
jgi:hypothetical protein